MKEIYLHISVATALFRLLIAMHDEAEGKKHKTYNFVRIHLRNLNNVKAT